MISWGGGPGEAWWRGRWLGLVSYPSTTLRVVPLPEQARGGNSGFVVVRDVAIEQSHAIAGRALVIEGAGLVGPGHAGDVEMRPFDALFDEALDEAGGGDRAGVARAD